MDLAHWFLVITAVLWTGWIVCCSLNSLWSLDLVRESDNCIDLSDTISIALLSISGFNSLLLFASLFICCMKMQSIYKELLCLIFLSYLAQLGLHITLFVYLNDVYWLLSHEDCHLDEDIINIMYYLTITSIVFPVSLFAIVCVATGYYLTKDPHGIHMDYFEVGDDSETDLMQHRRSRTARSDFDERGKIDSLAGAFTVNKFRGCLDWEDYKTLCDETDLEHMLKEKTFEPLAYDGYFILIEIEPQRATSLHSLEYVSFHGRDDTLLLGNKLPFHVTINDNNQIQNGYALYDEENDAIRGVHRIVCPTYNELLSVKEIKYRIGDEPQKIITVNHEQNAITLGESTSSWEDNAEIDHSYGDIKKAKICKFKQLGVTLYFEKITVYSSMRFPSKAQCERFATHHPDSPECKQRTLEMDADDLPILFEAERNMQVYYNPYNNVVYGMHNNTVDMSATHCGFGNAHSRNEYQKYFNGFEYYPYYVQNITQPYYMCCRYHFVMDYVLLGQDSQFNIFKSLCFLSARRDEKHRQLWARLSVSVLAILLQLLMTGGVSMEVIRNWDINLMFDDDTMIIIISFSVFAFLAYQYWFTVVKFFKFYTNMYYVADVDWIVPIMDFISNILVGGIVVFFSFAYLLLSKTTQDVVMNSFALQFIVELDDMANLFDADEEYLLEQDWHNCVNHVSSRHSKPWKEAEKDYDRDWDVSLVKRNINLNVPNMILQVVASVLLSPLFFIWAFVKLIDGMYYGIQTMTHTMNYTRNNRNKVEY
eukprot:42704_1